MRRGTAEPREGWPALPLHVSCFPVLRSSRSPVLPFSRSPVLPSSRARVMPRTADATRAPSVRTHTGHQMPVGAGRYFQRPHGEGRGQSMETRVIAVASPVASAHSTKRPRQARPRWSAARRLIPYLFVLPFVLLFAALFVAPLVYAFSQSLYTVPSSGLGFGPRQVI